MSWSQAQSQGQGGWQPHPFQTQAFDFHLVPVIEALADAVEGGARDQQVDELVHELATRFQKAEQILNSFGSNATEKDVTTQKRTLEDHRNKLEERRALLVKYKSMVDRIYPADT
ncbi:hypothetical protein M758_8G100800 [Ceratodon purpureus]|uniref:Mediator complex subunit 9 n=1 Tax=Ceratodon purpureus TaxID=3225 RepID=A0A8T0GZ78_CERPU|nr:hypothetical protein KC19_8G105200 [Ceratodon purpureus]KAG0608372.1 hypothetical protein M758_8G100800 [Ceratodon purpureus]